MHRILIYSMFFLGFVALGQNDSISKDSYLEDQFYIGFNYTLLKNTSKGVNERGFSNSLSLGFIKDLPFNERGSVALGIGLGYGRNTYYQNIKMEEVNNEVQFSILTQDISYKTNKFSLHNLEMPIEFRWRSSTRDRYKFWRIYGGTKLSYAFATNAKLTDDNGKLKVSGIEKINHFQQGLTLSVGYGTWNFNFYYGLTDIFDNAFLDSETPLKMKDYRIGLIFYIL